MIDLSLLIVGWKRRFIPDMSMQVAESHNFDRWAARTAGVLLQCAIVICFFLAPGQLSAQVEDPFGNPGDEIMTPTPVDDPSLTGTARLIVTTVRSSNPGTPEDLAKAVRTMMDIGIYRDARFYLNRLEGMGLSDEKIFEMHEKVGTDFFFQILTEEMVQPEGKRVAKTFLKAADRVARTPERMATLIGRLNHPDISVRSEAFRKMRRLGDEAVAEMINVFGDPARAKDYPGVRGALRHMGVAAQGPLVGASRAADARVQVEAIRALGYIDSPEATDVLMRAYASPKLPQAVRRMALDSLTRANVPADPERVEATLYKRSRDYLLGRQVTGALLGDVVVWQWDSATKRLVGNKVSPETAARIRAARQAADLYEIRPDLPRNRELFLLTYLEATKRLLGPTKRVDAAPLANQLKVDADEIEHILDQALKLELVPSAVACCEILEEIGSSEMLHKDSGRTCKLIDAILFGDRSLQFAAFRAITKMDPTTDYQGSSYVVELAVFLAQSESRPAGLIGHHQEDVGQSYAATLAAAGVVGTSVNSSRKLFELAKSNPDIEVLFVTDTLAMPNYVELIQQLQSDWRTRRIPIALLYQDTERSHRANLRVVNKDRFITIPFSLDPVMISTHVKRLNDLVAPWTVNSYQKRKHASAAVRWLAKISTDREKFGFYELGKMQLPLTRLLYMPGFADSASQILANLGTPSAQRELVNFASQSGFPFEERQRVVEAFRQSVLVGGTLLTSREIKQQYQRYNASETAAEETKQVLSAILDVIEARGQKTSD